MKAIKIAGRVAALTLAVVLLVGNMLSMETCPRCAAPLDLLAHRNVNGTEIYQYECQHCIREGLVGYVQNNYKDGQLVSGTPPLYARR